MKYNYQVLPESLAKKDKTHDLMISIIDYDYSEDKENRLHLNVSDSVGQDGPQLEHLLEAEKEVLKYKEGSNILIHCHAGVSRSPGLLLFLLMKIEEMDYLTAYKNMLQIRHSSYPNCQIVGICDDLFGLNGQLISIDREYKGL